MKDYSIGILGCTELPILYDMYKNEISGIEAYSPLEIALRKVHKEYINYIRLGLYSQCKSNYFILIHLVMRGIIEMFHIAILGTNEISQFIKKVIDGPYKK